MPVHTAFGAELTHLRSFEMKGPSGLAYDDLHCALWVANETREVMMISPFGHEIRRFTAEMPRVDAIAIEGDHLLLSDGNGNYQRVDRTGQSLGERYRLSQTLMDTDGLFVDGETSDYWVVDDTIAQLVRVQANGEVTQRVHGAEQTPQMMEPQGVTRDPLSGNILVVDDADATDSLFEFSPEGELLDVIPLDFAGLDAEGITLQPASSTLFIAFDDGDLIAAFHYTPTPTGEPGQLPSTGHCMISALPRLAAPV